MIWLKCSTSWRGKSQKKSRTLIKYHSKPNCVHPKIRLDTCSSPHTTCLLTEISPTLSSLSKLQLLRTLESLSTRIFCLSWLSVKFWMKLPSSQSTILVQMILQLKFRVSSKKKQNHYTSTEDLFTSNAWHMLSTWLGSMK